MTTSFPAGLDTLVNPISSDHLDNPAHAAEHANVNDAVEALEAKVGIDGSLVTTSLDNMIAANLGKPMNLTGAVNNTRYVGGTLTTPPTSGTFNQGDFVVIRSGDIAVCTAGGSPGTWVTLKGSSTAGMTLADYIIYRSGATFFARNTATNTDDYSSTNAAAVVQSAHDAMLTGGVIQLKSGVTYTATTMVTLSRAGVLVWSRVQAGEDQPTTWAVTATLAAGQAAFRMTGPGAAVGGLSVEANGNADYCIDMRAGGQHFFDSNVKEANIANLYLDGPNGAARCTIWNIRSDNPLGSGGINYKFDGPDHIAWGLRSTGAATNGYGLWMDTSRMQISAGHITGNGPEIACVFISGDENRISDVYLDTGPDGTNGLAHTVIQGNGNYLSALIQNASTVAPVNVTAVAFVSGNTYRFTTSTPHGFTPGKAVWLEGFASSNGAFLSSATKNVLVSSPIPDTTHFDADLGAPTTFTDAVGTAKQITKYGLLFQKTSSGSFVEGNEVHINFQGKGANLNTGEFYYAVGFLDENGNDVTAFTRFAGNRIYANAANATRFSNVETTWGTITNVDKVFVDAWQYQGDTTTPMTWRTRAKGQTAASAGPTWTINHGCAGLPNMVHVTPAANPGTATWYVSSVTATQIVITASASITGMKWYWEAAM
jgi:hypothetical protein